MAPCCPLRRRGRSRRPSDRNVLMLGSPGAGTSRLARRLTTMLPAMTLSLAEGIDATRIHGMAGLTGHRTACVTTRPCRAPHHTISDVGLIGGGQVPMPGEGSRAHHGVLLLDELPECRRHVLEVRRQPLEQYVLSIQSSADDRSHGAGNVSRMNVHHLGFYQSRSVSASPTWASGMGSHPRRHPVSPAGHTSQMAV
jgi:magnesium chelatase family protein